MVWATLSSSTVLSTISIFQVKSAFRVFWLVNLEVISKVLLWANNKKRAQSTIRWFVMYLFIYIDIWQYPRY